MKIAYYPGCSLHASSELYDVQSKLVFKELGVELEELEDWNCCGASSASKTDAFLAVALPARNIGIAEASGHSEIVIPCSSCYSRTLVGQKRLKEDEALKAEINAELGKPVKGTLKVRSVVEMLLDKIDPEKLPAEAKERLKGLKPACYYGCLLTRFPSDMEIPDDVENPQGMERLTSIFGAEPIDWAYKTDCCGASAVVNDQALSLRLMSRIMEDAVARGANCYVTSCPMCQFNLDAYQQKVAETHGVNTVLPVYFITELVGLALGLTPEKMMVDRHMTEATSLLKEQKTQ